MILLASVVLATGVATGLDLFLTIAVAGVLVAIQPAGPFPAAEGLGSPLLMVPALASWFFEAWMERRAGWDQVWRLVQLLVRPAGAFGLTALLLVELPLGSRMFAASTAAMLAGLVQACRSGWALLARLDGAGVRLRRRLSLEDGVVVLLVASLWFLPWLAFAFAVAILSVTLVRTPTLLAGAALAARLVRAKVLCLIRARRWVSPVDFPSWMKARLAPSGVVTGGRLRGVSAACVGFPTSRSLRLGWVVVRGPQPLFAHRRGTEVESVPLTVDVNRGVVRGPLCFLAWASSSEHATLTLVFGDDGPDPERLLAELAA